MSYFPEIIQDNLRLMIAKISNSRKELEIRLVSDSIAQNENKQFNLSTPQIVSSPDFFNRLDVILKDAINSSDLDVVVPTAGGEYIPVVNANYFVDSFAESDAVDKFLFVIKLHKPLPASFKKLSSINLLLQRTEIVKNEIVYGGAIEKQLTKFGTPLSIDYSQNPFDKGIKNTQTYQNKTQITSSLPSYRLENIMSSSLYNARLIDYSEFKNFCNFSSAEKRLNNFKIKLENIESHLIEVSHSLHSNGQEFSTFNNNAKIIRAQNFTDINTILNNFTDYERYLYYDNQGTSLTSAPGLGKQYTDSSSSINLNKNISQQFNKEGFDIVYVLSGSSTEPLNILEDKYKLEDMNFNNTTSSIYLSFLMRASASMSDNLFHNNRQTASMPKYPMDSLKLQNIFKPVASGSEYKRYVFAASGSHWIPNPPNKIVGMQLIDLGSDSSDIILVSGSNIDKSAVRAVGDYAHYLTYYTGSGKFTSGSFVPRGDLFNLSINPTGDNNLSGIITDVKVTSKNPVQIKPFHHLNATDSAEFSSWYDGMAASASFYDNQNIQRLVNNIPGAFLDDATTNQELLTYVNTIGGFFDEYRNLIDDYYRLFNKGYSDYEQVPSKYNKILAENLGFNILPIEENNFLKMFGIGENLNTTNEYSNRVINNILNNISYLYKTKGTTNSIKALLNCYGLPSSVLRIKEGTQNYTSYDQTILSNDTAISTLSVFDITGSVSFTNDTQAFNSLIINESFDKDEFKFNWNSDSSISQSAIEAIFKIPSHTTNTMSLISSKNNDDSKELWHLQLFPSGSNDPNKAKLRFRISPTAGGSITSGIQTSSIFVDTDFINITDNELINVVLQKSSSGYDTSAIHTYDLIVGKSTSNKISFLNSSTLTIDGDSNESANINFISGSGGKHLLLCNDFTGSISQIKSWSTPLSLKAFKQHIFNKKSIVGNNYSSSIEDLQYYYPLQENYKSGSTTDFTIIDASTKQKGGNFNLDAGMFTSSSLANYDTTIVNSIKFPIYGAGGGSSQYSDNMVVIPEPMKLMGNLNNDTSVLRYNNYESEKDSVHTRELFLTRSPQEIINDFLVDNIGNLDFNDLFADPRDDFKNTYPDLDTFNEKLKDYKISVDMTRFMQATKKIFNSSFVESIKKLIPAKAKLTIGNVIKPTLTDRVKLPPLHERPSVVLMPQPVATKHNFATPGLNGGLFTPPDYSFIGFQSSTSSLGVFEQTSQDFNLGAASELDVRTKHIKDSSYRDSLLYQFPQKLWGPGVNDIHFKSEYSRGQAGDYNTYHYEEDAVFTSLYDSEIIINTTSSFSGIINTNYKSSVNFANKKILQTSPVIGKRPLGMTQQLYTTSSTESPYGVVLDSDTRIPTNHIAYFQYSSYYDNFYKGTKLGNYNNTSGHPGSETWTNESNESYPNFSPFSQDNPAEWEDLATASFYRVTLGSNNNNTLRVIRPDNTNQGNQTN